MSTARAIQTLLIFAFTFVMMPQVYAQSYSLRDAGYVTSSRNLEVLSYIVCLEEETNKQSRRLNLQTALGNAVRSCRRDAMKLPRGRNEPTAEEIKLSILECGFAPGDASADMNCNSNGSTVRADTIEIAPTLIDTGKWLEGIAYDGKFIWAAESGQRTVAEIDFNSHEIAKRYKVGRLPIEVVTDGSGNTFSLIATDSKIIRHDPRRNTSTLTTLAEYPEAMILDDGELWVLVSPSGSSDTSMVVRVDTQSGRQQKSRDLGEWATDILALDDKIWVSHARHAKISIVDKRTLRAHVVSVPNADIWQLTTDLNFVYGAGRTSESSDDGVVVKINPVTLQEEGRATFPEMIMEVTTDGVFVYAIGKSGKIWIVSAVEMNVLRLVNPVTLGASYAPVDAMIIEDFLVVGARRYFEADGSPIKDRRGVEDENGGIMLFANILPDGSFAMTERPDRGGRSIRPTTTGRPNRPTTIGRPNSPAITGQPNRPTTIKRPNRPTNNTANNSRPTRPTVGGGRPSRPTIGGGNRQQFPVIAGSRGGNVRGAPGINGKKVGSTSSGQPVTLLENTGKMYKGLPWFKVQMGNGTIGYQWGGAICANPRNPVLGTKGICERVTTQRPRPTGGNRGNGNRSGGNNGGGNQGGGNSNNSDTVDVVIGILDLFGKIVESGNKNANSDVFTQTLQLRANGDGAVASRKLSQKQLAVYTVKGKKGETMDVSIWSPSQNAVFEIYVDLAVDGGATLPGAAQAANTQSFRGPLPKTGDYKIVVGSVSGVVDFEMVVSLEQIGNVADNKLLVGTYSSRTATSGNILLDEATNSLTWEVFCRAPVSVNVDWTFGKLTMAGRPRGVFDLNISNPGDIVGFQNRRHTYVKQDGIMMPGCAAAPAADAGQAASWQDSPRDPRANKDYSGVPNAYWQICETGNYDPTSPNFNNETAYWNCADQGLIEAEEPIYDSRAANDYSLVPAPLEQACAAGVLNSPQANKVYYDCMDQAHMNTLEELEDAGGGAGENEIDLNPGGAYSSLEQEVLQICQGDTACLDAAISQASRANAQGIVNRLEGEFADLNDSDIAICDTETWGSDAFFQCLAQVQLNKNATATGTNDNEGKEPGWDRADVFYQPAYDHCAGQLQIEENSSAYSDCYYAFPNYTPANSDTSSDTSVQPNPQDIQTRIANEFSDLTEQEIAGCETYGYGSDDFFVCLANVRANKADQAASEAEQQRVAEEQRLAAEQEAANAAQSPANDNGDAQDPLAQLQAYCTNSYEGDVAQQCNQTISVCYGSYPDLNSPDFAACVGDW